MPEFKHSDHLLYELLEHGYITKQYFDADVLGFVFELIKGNKVIKRTIPKKELDSLVFDYEFITHIIWKNLYDEFMQAGGY